MNEKFYIKDNEYTYEEAIKEFFKEYDLNKAQLNIETFKKSVKIIYCGFLPKDAKLDEINDVIPFLRGSCSKDDQKEIVIKFLDDAFNADFSNTMLFNCGAKDLVKILEKLLKKVTGIEPSPTVPEPTTKIEENPDCGKTYNCEVVASLIDNCRELIDKSDEVIDVIEEFDWYENQVVKRTDDFFIKKGEVEVDYRCVAIMNESKQVAAVGYLQPSDDDVKQYLVFENSENIKGQWFDDSKTNYNIVLFPKMGVKYENNRLYLVKCKINYKTMPKSNRTLCIDFGTSNTTAGTYSKDCNDGSYELVKFQDGNGILREMIPTIVLVESCANCNKPTDVKYIFGYEAQQKIVANDYSTDASVFHEIKRWMNELDTIEEIRDESGNKYKIERREIVRAYIKYVIDSAEQQFKERFKKVHFTTPVKVKESYLNEFKKMLPEYTFKKSEVTLDEGTSVIYHYITQNRGSNDMKKNHIVVIDCGGGTTDLASCTYKYEDYQDAPKLIINTAFEKGDSNFGGNNITFRILQLIKIKMAYAIRNEGNILAQSLFVKNKAVVTDDAGTNNKTNILTENDILEQIDSGKYADVYSTFDEKYQEMEKYIPTQFANYSGRNEKKHARRNYFYLWKMAEAMKIAFFKEDELATVSFQKDKDREIIVGDNQNYYLYYNNGKTLEQVSAQLSDIEVTVFEIKRVIYGDIYNLLNNLLGDMDSTNVKYYLSGQSCKINLFHDLLKEFIPGKCMRLKNTASSGDLKMNCIRGSIQYLADKDSGKIQSQFVMQMPELIYRVANCSDVNHEKDVLYLNETGEMEIVSSEKPFATTYQDFKVYDQHNVLKYSFRYNIGRNPKAIELEEGSEFVKQLLDECSLSREKLNEFLNTEVAGTRLDVDNKDNSGQVNKKMINFCLPDKSGYGFRIYTVVVDPNHNYHLLNNGNGIYYSYEPTHMEIFFDGKR